MYPHAVIIGHPCVGGQRELEHSAVILYAGPVAGQQLLPLLGDGSLQKPDLRLLGLNLILVFLNGLFLIVDIRLITYDITILLFYQLLKISLFDFHIFPGLVQNLFLQLQLLLAELHILFRRLVVLPHLMVRRHHLLHVVHPVQEIPEALSLQQHIKNARLSRLVGNPDVDSHGLLLVLLPLLSGLQFGLGLGDFLLLGGDLAFQFGDLLLYQFQVAVQLLHIILQVILLGFQFLLHLLEVAEAVLQGLFLILLLGNLVLFLLDAVREAFGRAGGRYGQAPGPDPRYGCAANQQCRCQTANHPAN